MAKDRTISNVPGLPDEPKSDAGVTLGAGTEEDSTPLRLVIRPIKNGGARVYMYGGDQVKMLTLATHAELLALRIEVNRALGGVNE